MITDFEPALPRAARLCRVPFVSLNHQHFLRTYDLGSLPFYLLLHAAMMANVVRFYCSGQSETIVSAFYFPPLRRGVRKVTQVGVLLRPQVKNTEPTDEGHVTAYFRKPMPDFVLHALAGLGCPVHMFGFGQRRRSGPLIFHPIDESGFIQNLASSQALISTAGNQLVGEALFFGKLVFAISEERNYEQYINAHFLRSSGVGDFCEVREVTSGVLRLFRANLESYRPQIDRSRLDGLPKVLEILRRHLNRTQTEGVALLPAVPALS